MEKRGFSHIEMVLGFVIFIGAVIFSLVYFNMNFSKKENVNEDVYKKISNEIKDNLTQYTLVINRSSIPSGGGNPKSRTFPVEVNATGKSSVFNYSNFKTESSLSNGILLINITSKGDIYSILISNSISNNKTLSSQGIGNPNKAEYRLNPPVKRLVFTEKKLIDLNNSYYSSYATLKGKIGISQDFAIFAKIGNTEYMMTREKGNKGVFAKNERIEILKEDGRVEFIDMRIEVWS